MGLVGQREGDGLARLRAALDGVGVGWGEVAGYEELGGGTYNTVFRVRLDGRPGLVVKLAPDSGSPGLRYERGILATEARFYALAGEVAGVETPAALPSAGGDGVSPDHLVMTECAGTPLHALGDRIGAIERASLRRELGRWTAALHTITGDAFGYPAEPWGPLRATWREAFLEMVGAVLDDAGRFGVPLPRPAREIRELFASRGPLLDEVTVPVLVHFDLWDGNILVDRGDGGPRLSALIDAERAFWGDPLAEFVSLALFGDIEEDDAFLNGYRSGGGPAVIDAAARERLALYRAYLYLIMWVEAVPRGFGAEHRDWLRQAVVRPLTAVLDAWAVEHRREGA